MLDPIVDEVRKIRMEHTLKFNGNLEAICADLRSIQQASGYRVVSFPPVRADVAVPEEYVPVRCQA